MGNVSGMANDWKQVEFGGELLEDSAGGAFSVQFLTLILRSELAELPVPNQHILTPDSSELGQKPFSFK